MKIILLFIGIFITVETQAATCITTTRTNFTSGQVLTSTALNADLNQLVSKVNSLDGGCVTDGTLEAAALNSTDFATVTNGIHQGCAVTYSDSNTVSVDKCILSVDGNFVKTVSANTATWGCSGCASEVVSTQYYLYAKTGSVGTTLNLLISTTAPGADGYDVLGNKAVGSFYNNASSAIVSNSVESWVVSKFLNSKEFNFTVSYYGVNTTTKCTGIGTDCTTGNDSGMVALIERQASTGLYNLTLSRSVTSISCSGSADESLGTPAHFSYYYQPGPISVIEFATYTSTSAYVVADTFGNISCKGYY